jgi:FkbM family methyltransferase
LSTKDDQGQGGRVSLPQADGRSGGESHQDAQPIRSVKVLFDPANLLVVQDPTAEYIQILVLVPLADGSATETKVTFGTPTKLFRPDGKLEYKMVIDSNFSITQSEKEPTGRVKVETRDGLKWEIPATYPGARTGLLDHEPIVKDFLISYFQQGKVFVDIGANVGAYSLRAAASGMEVHSFEPNPENIKVLKRNAELNQLSIDLLEYAIGSSTGTVKLSPNGATSRITEGDGIEIPIRALDSFNLPKVDVLKVDVEGYELEVLRGAEGTLERCRPVLMIEMHHWVGAEKEAALFEILSRRGYRFEYLDRYPQGRHLAATYNR